MCSLADLNVGELLELGEADLKSPGLIFQSLFLLPLGLPRPCGLGRFSQHRMNAFLQRV